MRICTCRLARHRLLGNSSGLLVRLGLRMLMPLMACLSKGASTQAAENQYNPVFAKRCHVHVRIGYFQIGGKGIKGFSFKKPTKIISPKIIGRAGVFG
ncbi:MAG TPA: hypothetical protein PK971_15520, partial [Saprospiraceae bacterium]|nr:hypothetical protein [Saprospiraceae bacterium]